MKCKFSFLPILILLFFFSLLACQKENVLVSRSLQSYIDAHPEWTSFNELVACAAGGQKGFLDDPVQPLSMFFYPKLYSTNFKYYETGPGEVNPDDLSLYIEKTAELEPLFNGFMARFPLPRPDQDRWARVSFVSNDTLWYCKPVRFKINEKPTEFQPELIEIDLDQDYQPTFRWPTENDETNIIYFQIVVDQRGDAISATYTTEKEWTYYDISNVVFNVTRPGPILPLERNKAYSIILMGISSDNWVNNLAEKPFRTE